MKINTIAESNNKRIAKNTLFLYMRMLVILLVTLYTARVVLRELGVEDYGIFNLVGGLITMLSFVSTAISNGFQRFYSIELGKSNISRLIELFSVSVSIECIFALIVLVVGETIGLWFLNNYLNIPSDRLFAANCVYQATIFMFVLTLFRAPLNAVIVSYEKMSVYAYISIFEAFAKLLIVYLLSLFNVDKLILYAFLHVTISLITFSLYCFFAFRANPNLSFKPIILKDDIHRLINFSGWSLFGSFAHMLKGNGINILLNIFFNPTVNAARAIAYQVSSALTSLTSSIMTASSPQIIKYYSQGNYDDMLELDNRVSRYTLVLLSVLAFPIIFNIQFIMNIWLGDNVPELAPQFCIVILLTSLVESMGAPISTLVHASGKMKYFQVVVSFIVLMIVPFAYIVLKLGAIPIYAMYVSLVMAVIAHVARVIIVKTIIPFPIAQYLKEVIMPCVLNIIIIAVILFVFTKCQMNNIFMVIGSFIISFVVSLYVGINRRERIAIYNKIINIIQK